jgi:homoprotocatechuate degradation regulator HpaR
MQRSHHRAGDGSPNVLLLLLRVREALLQSFRPILAHFGLTEQQWRVLRILMEAGAPLEPHEIARVGQFLGPSLVGVFRRMERAGIIAKTPSASDRRRLFVSLTPQGEALCAAARPLIDAQYRLIADRLGAGDAAELTRLLGRIDRALLADPLPHVPLPEAAPSPADCP